MDEVAFLETQNISLHPGLTATHTQIRSVFGFNWIDVQWRDLCKPLYSGLAARLFLSILAKSIPFGIKEQAIYWKAFYNTKQRSKTVAKFVQDIQVLEREQSKWI